MIVSILPHSTYLVQPTRKPAIVLEFIKGNERICVLGYPQLSGDKETFISIFEELTGFRWNGPAIDWEQHNRSILDKLDEPVRELFDV